MKFQVLWGVIPAVLLVQNVVAMFMNKMSDIFVILVILDSY